MTTNPHAVERLHKPKAIALLNPIEGLRRFYQNRDLIVQFTLRSIELRHRGSLLGFLWALLNPLLMLGLYVFVFRTVFRGRFGVVSTETPWDFGLGVFLGLSFHHLLSEVIAVAPQIIVSNTNLVKKVVFPLEILPAAAVGASVFHFSISVILIAIGLISVGSTASIGILWLPIVALPIALLALGLAWLFSALGVYFRDIGQIVPALSLILLFTSGVFYSAHHVAAESPVAWSFLKFNPLLHAIDVARETALWDRPMQFGQLGYVYGCGVGTCLVGYLVFSRLRKGFADVL